MSLSQPPFTIALPAGRLGEESVDFLKKAGLAEFEIPPKSRELIFRDTTGNYQIVMMRSRDVPTCVLQGGADAGITGRDVLAERGYDLTVPLQLSFGFCRLALAAPQGAEEDILKKPRLKVATKYPRLAMDYFYKRGINCEVIKLNGAIEIAPLLGLSDCIIDLVSTGNTLKANGLVEVDEILQSSAMLLVNRSAYALRSKETSDMLRKFRAAEENA